MPPAAALNGTASSTFSREGTQLLDLQGDPGRPRPPGRGQIPPLLPGRRPGRAGRLAGRAAGAGHGLDKRPAGRAAGPDRRRAASPRLNMAVDLARPLLTWTNPQRAIKQNLNVLLAMALDAGFVYIFYRLCPGPAPCRPRTAGVLLLAMFAAAVLAAAGSLFFLAASPPGATPRSRRLVAGSKKQVDIVNSIPYTLHACRINSPLGLGVAHTISSTCHIRRSYT
ncbi:MAG: hypothetical protein MZV70_60330 [Desulfobacterales bacterium]|nr:hypothetical protein [Desulfobacterales bacterium]